MSDSVQPVRVEELDWRSLLPFTRLFGSFRMALDPAKMALALLMVVLLYVGGLAMDAAAGPGADAGAIQQYDSEARFRLWVNDQSARGSRKGVFATALEFKLDAFERLMTAAASLRLGLEQLAWAGPRDPRSVVGAMRDLAVVLPGWLYHEHPAFLSVWCAYGLVIWALLGGAIARLAAGQASRGLQLPPASALRFAMGRFVWFVIAPLLPLFVAGLIGFAILTLGGVLFFNLPGLDILGALLFGVAIFAGLVVALLLVGLMSAGHLFYPTIAVEGTDAFDAISRSFNYVLGRPWRWLFYNGVALVYGAATYLFVGLVIFLALLMTHQFVRLGVFRRLPEVSNSFDAIFPRPRLGQLTYGRNIRWDQLGPTGKIAAALIGVWVYLAVGLLASYAISYYFCVQTWIYLLLRRAADGTELEELHVESSAPVKATTPADAPKDQPE